MIAVEQALIKFHNDLDKATDLLNLLLSYRTFASQAVPATVQGAWGAAEDLHAAAPAVRTDLPILSGSLHLYLCGRFERCVRDLVEAFVDELVNKATEYEDLPPALRKEVLVRTLTINQSPSKYGYEVADAESLVLELANNMSATSAGTVALRAKIVTITESNMNPGTLAEVLKRVGVVELWENLGKQSHLKRHLAQSGDRDCATEAKAQLEEIMRVRNRVAHPSDNTEFPDLESTLKTADYFRVLSMVLKDFMLVSQLP